MITTVDTSVLLDVLADDSAHAGQSEAPLAHAAYRGFYRKYFSGLEILGA